MIETKIYSEAIAKAIKFSNIDYERFRDKTFLITGATGLLGKFLIYILDLANTKYDLNIQLILLGRNKEKLNYEFSNLSCPKLDYIVQDINEPIEFEGEINYVIHTAASTKSLEFVKNPVEVIETNYNGTYNLLRFVSEKKVDRFVYLSSMEVYGNCKHENELFESSTLLLNSLNARDSYPMSKAISEVVCNSYYLEYNIPITILRLAQTFGPGVNISDSRLFADIAKCALRKEPIKLHTNGATKRPYLYIADAVEAILMILIDPRSIGETYNVANRETYCSVLDFAICASTLFEIPIEFHIDEKQRGYSNQVNYNLNTRKIENLGWKPKYNLDDMLSILVNYLAENYGEDL